MELNKQQKQLLELFKMQYDFDTTIFKKKSILAYPIWRVKNALANELQELVQWLEKAWKYWKTHARWFLNDEQSRKEALEEFVDCLHFVLSLTIFNFGCNFNKIEYYVSKISYDVCDVYGFRISDETIDNEEHARIIFGLVDDINHTDQPLRQLFELGHYLGFTWEEIYDCYKMKNAKNYQRQEENY